MRFAKALYQWPKQKPLSRSPTSINELVARFSCDDVDKYIFDNYEKWSSYKISCESFNVDLVAVSELKNSTTSFTDCNDNGKVLYEWTLQSNIFFLQSNIYFMNGIFNQI